MTTFSSQSDSVEINTINDNIKELNNSSKSDFIESHKSNINKIESQKNETKNTIEIKNLRNIVVKDFQKFECIICLEKLFTDPDKSNNNNNDTLNENEKVVEILPCGHAFHKEPCLKNWMNKRAVCPICEKKYDNNIFNPSQTDIKQSSENIEDESIGEEYMRMYERQINSGSSDNTPFFWGIGVGCCWIPIVGLGIPILLSRLIYIKGKKLYRSIKERRRNRRQRRNHSRDSQTRENNLETIS